MSDLSRTGVAGESAIGFQGPAAALGVVFIWATWLVAMRMGAHSSLSALDLSLIRFGIPALLLAPVVLRTGLLPKGVSPLLIALMVIGSGAPFFYVVAYGMRYTPASAAGVLLPGIMPLATALIGIAVLGERPDWLRKTGMAAIFGGGVMLLAGRPDDAQLTWISWAILPACATLWAIYTHAFRRTGLNAFQGAALVTAWSTLINLALLPFVGSGLMVAGFDEVGPQLVMQGILSGLLSTVLYGVAINRLGGTRAAAFTAATPVAAIFGGFAVLGEAVNGWMIAAGLLTACGVVLSTGLLSRRR